MNRKDIIEGHGQSVDITVIALHVPVQFHMLRWCLETVQVRCGTVGTYTLGVGLKQMCGVGLKQMCLVQIHSFAIFCNCFSILYSSITGTQLLHD